MKKASKLPDPDSLGKSSDNDDGHPWATKSPLKRCGGLRRLQQPEVKKAHTQREQSKERPFPSLEKTGVSVQCMKPLQHNGFWQTEKRAALSLTKGSQKHNDLEQTGDDWWSGCSAEPSGDSVPVSGSEKNGIVGDATQYQLFFNRYWRFI